MNIEPIGHIRTCYHEKFAVPRQPGLVDEAWGHLYFEPEFRDPATVRGLEGFSHVWLIFLFHQAVRDHWKPTVRPPRLGGNERVGVFASRSPFRPNPIGLSVVRLDAIDLDHADGPVLKLRGVDLVDGTPILDIKPYIAYADALPEAVSGFAPSAPSRLDVHWLNNCRDGLSREAIAVIESTLSIDPRPAYQKTSQAAQTREYGCKINGYDLRWCVDGNNLNILQCQTSA